MIGNTQKLDQTRERTEVFARIKTIVAAQTGLDTALPPETTLQEDLGMDSLELIDLCLALEREFALSLDTQELRKCSRLDDLTSLVIRARANNEALNV